MALGDGSYQFVGSVPCRASGRYGYTLRVLPQNEDLDSPYLPGYVLWGA